MDRIALIVISIFGTNILKHFVQIAGGYRMLTKKHFKTYIEEDEWIISVICPSCVERYHVPLSFLEEEMMLEAGNTPCAMAGCNGTATHWIRLLNRP
jgi:hypothetical protein